MYSQFNSNLSTKCNDGNKEEKSPLETFIYRSHSFSISGIPTADSIKSRVLNPSPQQTFLTEKSFSEHVIIRSESFANYLQKPIPTNDSEKTIKELKEVNEIMKLQHENEMKHVLHQHQLKIMEIENNFKMKVQSLETESLFKTWQHQEEIKELKRQLEKQEIQSDLAIKELKQKFEMEKMQLEDKNKKLQGELKVKEWENKFNISIYQKMLAAKDLEGKTKKKKYVKPKNRK